VTEPGAVPNVFGFGATIELEPLDDPARDDSTNLCVLKSHCSRELANVSLVVSYLDIPDLTSISRAYPQLAPLTSDPILHRNRLRLTAPSRLAHSLFGTSPGGILLRPSVGELFQRGVMKGFGFERRWRAGGYFYSPRVRAGLLRFFEGRLTDNRWYPSTRALSDCTVAMLRTSFPLSSAAVFSPRIPVCSSPHIPSLGGPISTVPLRV
jgi:hypothetical protein